MRLHKFFHGAGIAGTLALLAATSRPGVGAQGARGGQGGAEAIRIDSDDIGGVVTSAKGPEAGVWVVAETTELPTRYSKVVVTNDRGQYVVPDLPKATYSVWVRGYGLVDSPKVQAAPGRIVNLTAVVAPNARAAAQYYPGNYWYSMLHVPAKSEFPGTGLGPGGNGIPEAIRTQAQYLDRLKTTTCQVCHQLGDKATREIPEAFGKFEKSVDAWVRRLESGQAGLGMSNGLAAIGRQRALAMFADWTDRIAAGEVPPAPPRPSGVERNIVLTNWDFGDPKTYIHDAISTDKRNPTVNANGPIYGAPELSADTISVLDPVRNTVSELAVPVRDPDTPYTVPQRTIQPSAYWGDEIVWTAKTSAHSPMIDGQGRMWVTSAIRPPETPAFCRQGSTHPSAKLFPIDKGARQVAFYDPKTKRFTLIDTCFTTHHLEFAEDANNTLYFTSTGGPGGMLGWLNTKMFDETHDEQKSQGWAPFILDTNANGTRDAWTEPGQPADPAKDTRVQATLYSVIPSPVDGSIWGSVNSFPGAILHVMLGSNPPQTTLTEIYEPPFNNPKAPVEGYVPRGLDIDRTGVVWVNLSGSSHLASFDRRKCKGPINGPTATGQHCPEGWTLYPLPGPHFTGVTDSGSADATYLDWVDQWDVFGLGKNTPFAFGNGSDSLHALLPSGQWVNLRVPYPMSFYAKGMDGRIDDAKAGWKGRGLFVSDGGRAPWHIEGGKGTRPKVHKFQLRPDPLAH